MHCRNAIVKTLSFRQSYIGVVQLFNAVRQQQIEIKTRLSRAGPLERKREQIFKSIDKNAFLDDLMGGSKSIPVDNEVKSEKPVEQTNNKDKDHKMWSVLRDDFVMGAKLKDWDKKNDSTGIVFSQIPTLHQYYINIIIF